MTSAYPAQREVHLGQEVFFVLWDDDTERAAVVRAEVVQYASDWSKVRVRVAEAPQLNVIGRATWVLPDRLDADPRSARRHYQQRARRELRAELERAHAAEADKTDADKTEADKTEAAGEGNAVGSAAAEESWRAVQAGWADVELLVDTMDFESGWPENQARLAKFATMALLRVRPAIEQALGQLPADTHVEAVRGGLGGGLLGVVEPLCAGDPAAVLSHWDEVPPAEVVAAADYLTGLRGALDALAAAHDLPPLGG